MRSRKIPILLLIVALAMLAGCVSVTPQWAAKAETDAANAKAFDAKVQALTNPISDADLTAIKRWSAADKSEWANMANWMNKRPSTQP
jgi:outer membrane murein-binding lipoprotein Lpp